MMTYGYIRFSTSQQEETQQMFALKEYATQRGLTIDAFEKDEGVSGGVSYKDRKLYGLIQMMGEGDTLITTEISRLGRSMSDLNKLVNDEFVPRKIRLIVAKMGLDLNCSNLSAVDQMIIFAFGFSAQLEKEMIQQRTQSALDARKETLKREGGFFSKNGNWTTHLGPPKGFDPVVGRQAAAMLANKKSREWREASPLYSWVTIQVLKHRPRKEILAEAADLYKKNPKEYGTREGAMLSKGILSKWVREIEREI